MTRLLRSEIQVTNSDKQTHDTFTFPEPNRKTLPLPLKSEFRPTIVAMLQM